MTKKTVWSDLPNAHHIDRVLASLKAHPKEWTMAYNAAWDTAWVVAGDTAWNMARDTAWNMARYAAYDAAMDIRLAARDVIAALVAYDDCAHYLDMPSDKLRVWAMLSENPAAILLLPAVIAFEKINLLECV